ncbi:hypothetical protein ACFYE9_15425 [Rhizobium leguminosarum]|uniref:Uncharacterized protein n=2 Tax=Rhizobium leguminosarum TaxID=384 RepID=A0A154IQ54_RHILE|nr:hypothetical protein [Rhizobium leguminosarum]KZB02110.1 hypothetical protein A4A59_11115 [Rhizobium leguminosarum]
MRSARGGGDAEPPQIIKNIIWLLQNWRSQTIPILLAGVVLATGFAWAYRAAIWGLFSAYKIGEFNITLVNTTDAKYRMDFPGELYACEPSVPGINIKVKSGLLWIVKDGEPLSYGYGVDVDPGKEVTYRAVLVKEDKWVPVVKAGDVFLQVIIGGHPHPVGEEYVLNRSLFKTGLRFEIKHPYLLNNCYQPSPGDKTFEDPR